MNRVTACVSPLGSFALVAMIMLVTPPLFAAERKPFIVQPYEVNEPAPSLIRPPAQGARRHVEIPAGIRYDSRDSVFLTRGGAVFELSGNRAVAGFLGGDRAADSISFSQGEMRKSELFSSASLQLQVSGEAVATGLSAGLRLDLPVGPVRFDYGMPIIHHRGGDHDTNDRSRRWMGPLDGPGPGYRRQKAGGVIPGWRG